MNVLKKQIMFSSQLCESNIKIFNADVIVGTRSLTLRLLKYDIDTLIFFDDWIYGWRYIELFVYPVYLTARSGSVVKRSKEVFQFRTLSSSI